MNDIYLVALINLKFTILLFKIKRFLVDMQVNMQYLLYKGTYAAFDPHLLRNTLSHFIPKNNLFTLTMPTDRHTFH